MSTPNSQSATRNLPFAQVVVNTPLGAIATPRDQSSAPALAESLRDRAFTYSIPPALENKIALGQLVWVPFGARKLQGVVVGFSDASPVEQTKSIADIVDARPFLSAAQIELARWIAHTYLCSLNDAIQLMLPAGVEQQTEILVSLTPTFPRKAGERETPKQLALIQFLEKEGETKLRDLPRELRAQVDALARRGILLKRVTLPAPRARPKRVKSVRLIADDARVDAALAQIAPRQPQADALEFLARGDALLPTVKEICAAVGCKKSALAALAQRGWIEIAPAQELISLTPKYFADVPALAEAQSRALVFLRERGAPVPRAELKGKANAIVLRALESKGYIERVQSAETVVLKLAPEVAREKSGELRGTGRYAAIVKYLRGENPAWVSAVYAATDATRQDLQKLGAAGIIALEEEEVWRDPLAGRAFEIVEPPRLTPEQESAWGQIVASLKPQVTSRKSPVAGQAAETWDMRPVTFLLHGVTGSGKTEIYLRALAEIIAQGKQGVALVPEISLTPQTIRRFGARFPNRLAVFHSRLSLGERYDTWRRCRDGLVDVVIGSRSALFMPLPRLGLIVLDEEHDAAYKQDATPHYHARDAALELARLTGATVILGSATPDLESYHRATRGEFKLLELPKRILAHTETIRNPKSEIRYLELPPVHIVDMRAELRAGNRAMFSRALQRELTRVLAAHEQAILFLNRRGSATFILCRDCGHVFKCKRCDNPLTYHGVGDALQCHHCGRRDRVPTKCPKCGSARIRYFGAGTEKVEEEVRKLFPEAQPLRWDYDVTRGKDSHEAILEKFILHQADVLIGTQMIAKGLDLPRVTLVGVVSADTGLHLPDFRASERTFQVLAQVAGRAGRSVLGGQVILQTYNPEHYAIQAAAQHDYRTFYAREIAFRREQGYPPFSRLIRLLYALANNSRAEAEATRMFRALTTRIAQKGLPALDLIGPAPAFFARVRGEYRWQILVRGENPHALAQDIALPLGWRVDVAPVSVL
ncbi:MAG: primosomal protein N' [Chloroflexi bacterium]|nr:primosomal protein N' [Chloroflexota bacterium]